MSELRAVTLATVAAVLVNGAACATLMLVGAGDEWVAIAMVLLLCVGSFLLSELVMHYGKPDRHR